MYYKGDNSYYFIDRLQNEMKPILQEYHHAVETNTVNILPKIRYATSAFTQVILHLINQDYSCLRPFSRKQGNLSKLNPESTGILYKPI